jgi:hypothetical protein
VEALALRPINVKVLLNKGGPVNVNLFDQGGGFLFCLAAGLDAPDFVLEEAVDKNMEGVATISEIICASPADDDALPDLSHLLYDGLSDGADAIGVHRFQPRRVHGAFKTSAQKRFEEAIVHGIPVLFSFLHGAPLAVQAGSDFICQLLVPEFPAQMLR